MTPAQNLGAPPEPGTTAVPGADQARGETAHLLRSPENARRLLASIARLENGGGRVRERADEAGP